MPRRIQLIPLFIFVSISVILVLVSLALLPYMSRASDRAYIISSLVMATLILFVAYYVRTYGTPRSEKVAATIGIGLLVGFPIAVVMWLSYKFLMGDIPVDLAILMFFVSYVISFMIGAYVSKKRL